MALLLKILSKLFKGLEATRHENTIKIRTSSLTAYSGDADIKPTINPMTRPDLK